jgi:hypothetical protein
MPLDQQAVSRFPRLMTAPRAQRLPRWDSRPGGDRVGRRRRAPARRSLKLPPNSPCESDARSPSRARSLVHRQRGRPSRRTRFAARPICWPQRTAARISRCERPVGRGSCRAGAAERELPSWQRFYLLSPEDSPRSRRAAREALAEGPLTRDELGAAVTARRRFRHLGFAFDDPTRF